jgi:hypothetical protein
MVFGMALVRWIVLVRGLRIVSDVDADGFVMARAEWNSSVVLLCSRG